MYLLLARRAGVGYYAVTVRTRLAVAVHAEGIPVTYKISLNTNLRQGGAYVGQRRTVPDSIQRHGVRLIDLILWFFRHTRKIIG